VPDLWTDLLGCLDLHIEDGERSGTHNVTLRFLRPFRTDRWLLLRQHSPVLAHGRCFGRGDVLTEDGALVASYAQEALLRFRDDGESVDTWPAAIVAVAEKRSHIAQNGRLGESYSRRGRILSSKNGSGVDTRRWLMTELPQILSATNYAVAARGEAL
jgi:hypothetical protein